MELDLYTMHIMYERVYNLRCTARFRFLGDSLVAPGEEASLPLCRI